MTKNGLATKVAINATNIATNTRDIGELKFSVKELHDKLDDVKLTIAKWSGIVIGAVFFINWILPLLIRLAENAVASF